MIPVTKPFLPARQVFDKYIDQIWERNWLTNDGPLVRMFEERVRTYLGIRHFLFVANGTLALQMAIKALNLRGEIITTPFSYVATTSSIVWESCKPVFADIDEATLNINPSNIEAVISPRTVGILATHCFGNACDIHAIETIAQKHKLKVIYDAAHCFGSKFEGRCLFSYGDVATTSFHATKLMHTVEGGGVSSNDPAIVERMALMRNFGHSGSMNYKGVGINAKNSEIHAAVGLCVLESIDLILQRRKAQCEYYDEVLSGLDVRKQSIFPGCDYNYAYYPIIFPNEQYCTKAKDMLERHGVFARRYFSPSLSQLEYVTRVEMPVSDSICGRILCLPLFHDLSEQDQDLIAKVLASV
jgi:dTDP-4-amino-4,6-dideoxygalactose transaminase